MLQTTSIHCWIMTLQTFWEWHNAISHEQHVHYTSKSLLTPRVDAKLQADTAETFVSLLWRSQLTLRPCIYIIRTQSKHAVRLALPEVLPLLPQYVLDIALFPKPAQLIWYEVLHLTFAASGDDYPAFISHFAEWNACATSCRKAGRLSGLLDWTPYVTSIHQHTCCSVRWTSNQTAVLWNWWVLLCDKLIQRATSYKS